MTKIVSSIAVLPLKLPAIISRPAGKRFVSVVENHLTDTSGVPDQATL
jgi:hypothetical protein